jgi:hypothetical protein
MPPSLDSSTPTLSDPMRKHAITMTGALTASNYCTLLLLPKGEESPQFAGENMSSSSSDASLKDNLLMSCLLSPPMTALPMPPHWSKYLPLYPPRMIYRFWLQDCHKVKIANDGIVGENLTERDQREMILR